MEQPDVKYQRSLGDWLGLFFFQLLSLPLFRLAYLQAIGKNKDDNSFLMIELLMTACAIFLFAFYRMFLKPYAIQFQNDEFLIIKSILFQKGVAIHEIQRVQIKHPFLNDVKAVHYIILKNGDSVRVPPLTHMTGFIKKLTLLYPQIEIKDER